jgi:hypothetical protein
VTKIAGEEIEFSIAPTSENLNDTKGTFADINKSDMVSTKSGMNSEHSPVKSNLSVVKEG